MREIKNVLICGLGAVGSIFAEKIKSSADNNLKILVDEKRLLKYKQNPVILNGKKLDFDYVLPEEKNFKADLIIVAVKSYGLSEVLDNIKNFVCRDTLIISLINGITSEKIISEKYGREKVLYSFFLGHSAMRKDNVIKQDGVYKIEFGAENPKDEENVLRLKKFFETAKINYTICEDIVYSLWKKFMLNVCVNQVSAILKMTFGEMTANPCCMDFLEKIMREVANIAEAEGIKNTNLMITETKQCIKTMMPEGKTSMFQDVEAGRMLETDIFSGTVIKLGLKHNIPTPYNQVLHDMLQIINFCF